MTEGKGSWSDRAAAARYEQEESQWGMYYVPDEGGDPLALAKAGFDRGDQLLQLDMPVMWVQGRTTVTNAATRIRRGQHWDVLGAIEAIGWRLEHVSTTFVEHGRTSVERLGAGTNAAAHGTLTGLYVFRRGSGT